MDAYPETRRSGKTLFVGHVRNNETWYSGTTLCTALSTRAKRVRWHPATMIDSANDSGGNLNVLDAVMLIVGVVIGAGIFALPAMVAANTTSPTHFLSAWVFGGAVSLAGALCYAELATAYPHSGGEHHFLKRAFGQSVGFLFAWSRLTVLQTGSIAIQAYIIGDYLARLLPATPYTSAIVAAVVIVLVTGINVAGIQLGRWTLVVLGIATCVGLLLVAACGLLGSSGAVAPAAPATDGTPAFGLAMVFVLLAYGGWNEAAYISADVSRRNMVRALMWGIAAITVIYVLVNLAYLRGLGMAGIAASSAPAADLVERTAGVGLGALTSLAIAIAALSTMNATTITGGRSNFALGRDVPLFEALGRSDNATQTPRTALIVQGAISILLVLLGAITRDGFAALVEYTAPVFWLFFFLVGASVFVLRAKDGARARPFRVPLYPFTPILFCGVCLYMIRASLAHTGLGALVGVAVLIAGLPVLWLARSRAAGPAILRHKQIES